MTTEQSSAIKGSEFLIHATVLMKPKILFGVEEVRQKRTYGTPI